MVARRCYCCSSALLKFERNLSLALSPSPARTSELMTHLRVQAERQQSLAAAERANGRAAAQPMQSANGLAKQSFGSRLQHENRQLQQQLSRMEQSVQEDKLQLEKLRAQTKQLQREAAEFEAKV